MAETCADGGQASSRGVLSDERDQRAISLQRNSKNSFFSVGFLFYRFIGERFRGGFVPEDQQARLHSSQAESLLRGDGLGGNAV